MQTRDMAAVLLRHAETHPDDLGLRLRSQNGWVTWTWLQYYQKARAAASALCEHGVRPSDHVLILEPDPIRAVPALFGAWMIGAVPTLTDPPAGPAKESRWAAEHVRTVAKRLDSKHLVLAPSMQRLAADLGSLVTINADALSQGDHRARLPHPGSSKAPAIIQLTSGTTEWPRGVVVSHELMLGHLARIQQALRLESHSSVFCWLPLSHDMGLYPGLLLPLYLRFPCTLMSPLEFRRRPLLWFEAASAFGITCIGGPPAAFGILERLAARAIQAGVDLSRVEYALIAAEFVPASLLSTFAAAYAPCGFRKDAFCPAYGMAECVAAITVPRRRCMSRIDTVDRDRFLRAFEAVPAAPHSDSLTFVGVGSAIPGNELRIVDDSGAHLPERRVGEIQVRMTGGTPAYHRDQTATGEAFRDGWLRTGDLGYLVEGELFVVGRKKDLIIKGGQNFSPGAIEGAVETVDGVRPGAAAAVGVYSEHTMTDLAWIVVESASAHAGNGALAQTIRTRLAECGLPADRVVLVPPKTLPRTSSGKVRRGELSEMIRQGRIEAW